MGKKHQPGLQKFSASGNLKNRFPESHKEQACYGSENSYPRRSDLHQTATGKTDFLSRTRNKHATEVRTAIRDEVTSIKRQLEKLISSVVQETSRQRSRERSTRSPVTSTQRQLKKSVVQVIHTGININLNIHTTNTNNNTWKLSPATGKTSRDNRQGRVSKQTRDFPRAQKYLGELQPIRRRLR